MPSQSALNIRLPESKLKILEDYCAKSGRTKTHGVREFIRSL